MEVGNVRLCARSTDSVFVILLVKQIGGIYVKRCGNKYFNGIYFKV